MKMLILFNLPAERLSQVIIGRSQTRSIVTTTKSIITIARSVTVIHFLPACK